MVAVAVMAGGCTSGDEVRQKERVPIRLTANVGVEALTRGADGKVVRTENTMTRGTQETALASGETVYVWAKEDGSSSWDYLKAWTLTADGSTGLSGSSQYYPLDGTGITMNAVHGNFASAPVEGTTAIASLTHSVAADQSAEGGYEKSDLLFGSATGSDASSAENIAFAHKLSKIEVNLTSGYGYDDSDLATAEVRLNNVLPSVAIDPTDGTIGSASGTATTITPRQDGTSYEAVIPPQTFTNPDALISVTTTKDGLTLTSTVPNDVTVFEGNTKYVYDVKALGKDPGLAANNETIDLGWVLGYNGKFYSTNEIASYYTTPIGVVVYKGTDANITENMGHGLVMALNNINNDATYSWTLNTTVATGYMDESFIANARSQNAIRGDYGGLSRTNTLATHACNASHSHPVFEQLKAWRENSTNAAPTTKGTTDWFILSGGQWIAVIEAIVAFKGHTVPTYSTTWGHWSNNGEQDYLDIKALLEEAGGTFPEGLGLGYNGQCALYASTSEYGSNGTYMGSIGFEFGNHTSSVAGTGFRTNFDYKPSPEFVRPFLAF